MDLLQWVKLKWQGEEKNLKNKMPRKTDAELLEELERTQKELKKAKKELGKEEGEEYSSEPYDEDEENRTKKRGSRIVNKGKTKDERNRDAFRKLR